MMINFPTRYWVLVMVYLASYINYAFTVNMALSIISMVKTKKNVVPYCLRHKYAANETHVLPDYGPRYDWDEYDQSVILGAYFWSHALFALPAGPLAEWFGPAKVIFWSNIFASVFNSLCVPAALFHRWALVACRFLLGVVGAMIYPALQALIAQWAPPNERGKFVAGLLGNTLASVVTWPLVGFVTHHFGWDWGFHVVSIQIFLFSLLFFAIASDSPDSHKFITDEEKFFIKSAQGNSVIYKKRKPPYKQILLNRPFWALVILHFGNLWGLYVQIQGVPKFMAEVIGFDLRRAGVLGATPSLVRLFMSITYGSINDYLKKNEIVSTNIIRKSFVLASHVIPGMLMFSICFIGCYWVPILILLVLSMSINGAVVITNLLNPQDLAPNYAGTIFGLMTFIDATTGFIVPAVTASFIQEHNGLKEWSYVFIIGGCMYTICGIFFIIFGSVKEQSYNEIKD